MNYKVKPALIGGGALGLLLVFTLLLSAVLRPIGCCNCLWPIAAGILATMIFVKGSPTPASVVDGAVVGALAGVVGGVIYMIVGLPLSYFVSGGVEAIDMQIRQLSPDFPLSGVVLFVIGGVIGFIVFVVLATLGGLIGVPIFEKRKGTADTPPPPQDFGTGPGTGPGSYGPGL